MKTTTFVTLAGLSGAMALPNEYVKRADYACNPAHSYPNGASCVSTNGALSLVTPAAATSTGFACNPAHSYPNGASCVSTNGALSLVTATPAASTTGYACNPAHSYPNGASCVSTNGALSLVTAAPAATSTGYACNPAHSYPNGASCVSTNGALALVTPAATTVATSTVYACNPAHSYPNGATCTAVNGALTLVTPAATTAAPAAKATSALGTWTIENLVRTCTANGSGCNYTFQIKTFDGFGDNCTISQPTVGPTGNWGGAVCKEGSLFKAGWGYSNYFATPFAVLTIDQIQDKTRAFFGVPDVNGQKTGAFGSGTWAKLGPEAVAPVN